MENIEGRRNDRDESRSRLSKKQIIAIVLGSVVVVGGLVAAGIYLLNNTDRQATVIANDGNSTIALMEGKNKITSGGTYSFSGSVSNGKIVVDTVEEVKLILNNVSITNSEGAAIKCQENSNVSIELVGDNTLVSKDAGSSSEDPAAVISSDGELTIKGSGSATLSGKGKGIKADVALKIESGKINITSTDDALHSNGDIEISGGDYTIDTGDDAVHADGSLEIKAGSLNIAKSHEGIEANDVEISGGDISIIADDDGINAQNSDGSTRVGVSGDGNLTISGGKIYVNSAGDGLDSNGTMTISGGEIFVDGPTNNGNGAIDCDGEINITGGTIIAVGSSGMAQNATSASQPSVLMNLSGNYSGSFTFGEISYTPSKSYQSILISSDQLKIGETYSLIINGSQVQSVTISQNITGQGSGMMGSGGMLTMGGQPQQDQQNNQPQDGQPSQTNRQNTQSAAQGSRGRMQ